MLRALLVCTALLVAGCAADRTEVAGPSSPRESLPAAPATPTPPPVQPHLLVVISPAEVGTDRFVDGAVAAVRATAARLGGRAEVLATGNQRRLPGLIQQALARRPTLIIGLTDFTLEPIDVAAASNLDQQFLLVDSYADEPTDNLTSAVFNEHEGLYLEGVEAALMSRSGQVGLVGPDDEQYIRGWGVPFARGVHETRPSVTTTWAFAGGPEPFNDVRRARARAAALAAGGADLVAPVIFARDVSLVDGAAASSYLTFGADVDQCADAPGAVADSIVKRADVAIDASVDAVLHGETGGYLFFGLANGGLELASAAPGSPCVAAGLPEVQAAVADARAAIIDSTITITDPIGNLE